MTMSKNLVQKNRRRKKRGLKPLEGLRQSVMLTQASAKITKFYSTPCLAATREFEQKIIINDQ
ncbi:hypothetical protein H6G33_04185 [Calothrix sp. FACHB-1219]|uniref:hypothetical protein n=1 Tax=unclassified Calothrix TaxID=2619626 RepID=UPI0016882DF4|nr:MULTISPECIES: hypothetical protein [unclassified Calothrix]MBD2204948.1 hypothetical protein [Calothrix sp. FACHB-168]MBD2216227.1 hypothetical protein [Calothrix sp. FACHB-1219]